MVPANSTCKPKFKITEGKILAELLLLKPNLILAIENRMAKNFLQVDFQSRFVKTFRFFCFVLIDFVFVLFFNSFFFSFFLFIYVSIEVGLLEKNLQIHCRQACSYIICGFQDNVTHCGNYQKNYFEYTRCGIQNAYVTCSAADFRIPSLPIPTIGGQQSGD